MSGQPPDDPSSSSTGVLIVRYAAHYLIWLLICGIGLWLVFLIRTNLVEDVFFLRVNAWQLRAIDRWSVYVLGALWFVCVFLAEGILRRSMEQGRFWATAGGILGAEVAMAVVSLLINSA
jgi:hypothetical protein